MTDGTLTVLYVEDEECDQLFMRRAFQKAGLAEALRAVGDGREAIDYLAGTGVFTDRGQYPLPSVVLLDLNLPLLSGFEVLEWMKKRPELAALPVVVFSSSTRQDDKLKAAELGASDYVEKPTSGTKFGDVVGRLRERWLK